MNIPRLCPLFSLAALLGAGSVHAQVVTIFSDNFDAYADGKADTVLQALYNVPVPVGSFSVVTGAGLGGSKSLQNTVDAHLQRDTAASALALGAGGNLSHASVSLYFQYATAGGLAGPQIGFVGAPDGAFTGAADISARLNNNQLQLRSNNATVATDTTVQALTNGSWYQLVYAVEKTTTANTFNTTVSLFSSNASGGALTLLDSFSGTFANATMYGDGQVFAAIRENTSILNMDNFALTQGLAAVPEPASAAALAGVVMLAFATRRRRA